MSPDERAEHKRTLDRRRRAARRAKGLCVRCDQPVCPAVSAVMCEGHAAVNVEAQKRYRESEKGRASQARRTRKQRISGAEAARAIWRRNNEPGYREKRAAYMRNRGRTASGRAERLRLGRQWKKNNPEAWRRYAMSERGQYMARRRDVFKRLRRKFPNGIPPDVKRLASAGFELREWLRSTSH